MLTVSVLCFGAFIVAPAVIMAHLLGDEGQFHRGHNPNHIDEGSNYELVSNYCGDYVIVRKSC